jgi:hypothetical protein
MKPPAILQPKPGLLIIPVALAHKVWILDPGAAHASQGHHPVLLGELDVGLQHPLRAGFFRAAL